jgi:hypothetical protein
MLDTISGLWWLWLVLAVLSAVVVEVFWRKSNVNPPGAEQVRGFVEPVSLAGCFTCFTAIVAVVGIISAVLGIIALVLRLVAWKVGA